MNNTIDKTTMSGTRLFDSYRIANDREKFWANQLIEEVEPEESGMWFTYWNIERKLLYAEIERRADLYDKDVVLHLIETCQPFCFIDENRS